MNRPRIFYGWYIVAAGTLLITYTAWSIYFGFTAFVTPIAVATGWSYVQLSLAMSLLGVEAGALNPFMGMAVDRFPARRLVLIGVVIFGFGLFCISQVTTIAMFYMSFLLIGLGTSLAMQMVLMTATAR